MDGTLECLTIRIRNMTAEERKALDERHERIRHARNRRRMIGLAALITVATVLGGLLWLFIG